MNRWDNDNEFEEMTVKTVNPERGGWELEMNHSCLWVSEKYDGHDSPIPHPGSSIRIYPGHFRRIRGIIIDGKEAFYRTDEEQRQKDNEDGLKEDVKKQKELEATKEDRDKQWAALPPEFLQRKQRFMQNNETWRRDFETYELFVCEEAMKIVRHFKTEKALKKAIVDTKKKHPEFASWWEVCKEHGLEMDENHSGNTAGSAGELASTYLHNPRYVPFIHGALATLVGCKEYGCPPAKKSELPPKMSDINTSEVKNV